MDSRLLTSVVGVATSVRNSDGSAIAAATMASVSSQYSGITRITRRRKNSSGDVAIGCRDNHAEAADHENQVDAPVAVPGGQLGGG